MLHLLAALAAPLPFEPGTSPIEAGPLAVEIDAPKAVRSGEPFHVVARLVNRSKAPVIVVRPQVTAMALGMGFGGGLFRAEKPVATTLGGMKAFQWTEPWTYGPWAFQTLKPGEGVKIEDLVYQKAYVSGKAPSLKSEIAAAPTADLAPGEYTLRFVYTFQPEFHKNSKPRGGGPPRSLTPEGRKLYRSAWVGKAQATATVVVS